MTYFIPMVVGVLGLACVPAGAEPYATKVDQVSCDTLDQIDRTLADDLGPAIGGLRIVMRQFSLTADVRRDGAQDKLRLLDDSIDNLRELDGGSVTGFVAQLDQLAALAGRLRDETDASFRYVEPGEPGNNTDIALLGRSAIPKPYWQHLDKADEQHDALASLADQARERGCS